MQSIGRILFTVPIAFLFLGCSLVGSANELTKQKAMALLQDRSDQLEAYDFVLQLEKEVRPETTNSFLRSAWPRLRKSELEYLRILKVLAKEGILTEKKSTKDNRGWTLHSFEPSPVLREVSSDATVKPVSPPFGMTSNYVPLKKVSLIVARREFADVEGIFQEGKRAQAEVSIITKPTDAYGLITEIIERRNLPTEGPLSGWPLEFQTEPLIRTFHFAKYDDGWRLVR